jgi:protein-S-isoprenylcysteine O-methyltransferase Ste14
MVKDVPLAVVSGIICTYWSTVGLLVAYKAVRHAQSAGVIPRQAFERWLWLLIVPIMVAWIGLPMLAGRSTHPWLVLPSWAATLSWVYMVRWSGAVVAGLCYVASLYSWLLLGRHWSMAVVPAQTARLVTKGAYRWVRHPIYSLSVLMMLASFIVLPTGLMALLACTHIVVMNLKAWNEERHLKSAFGAAYVDYCRQAGRFWPRWSRVLFSTDCR